MNDRKKFLWPEKYRPSTIEECILPTDLKNTFDKIAESGNVPNLLLSGPAGVGKTTVALALMEQLDCSYMFVNGSLEGRNIDTIRTSIKQFASTVSLKKGRKYIILDEADYLNPQSVQPALRHFMEEFSGNCGFILTCNFKNRIIPPLHSRCTVIDFTIKKKDSQHLASSFHKRVCDILNTEGVEYDPAAIAHVIMKFFPDWRRVLNELQTMSTIFDKITTEVVQNYSYSDLDELVKALRNKDFTTMRKWVAQNLDNDPEKIFRKLFDDVTKFMQPSSVPQFIVLIGQYQYQAAFVADQEINLSAFLTEAMADCEFKS